MLCSRGDCPVQSAKVEFFKERKEKKPVANGVRSSKANYFHSEKTAFQVLTRPWGLDLWSSTPLLAIWTPGPVMLLQKLSLKASSYSLPCIYFYLLPTHWVMPFLRQFLNKLPTMQLLPVAWTQVLRWPHCIHRVVLARYDLRSLNCLWILNLSELGLRSV